MENSKQVLSTGNDFYQAVSDRVLGRRGHKEFRLVKEQHGFSEEEFLIAKNVILAMGSLKNNWMLDDAYFHDFVYYFRTLSNKGEIGIKSRDKGRKKLLHKLKKEEKNKQRFQDSRVIEKTGLA
jgi:hypothetical protein